jgi:ATP-grasp domain, R2K clade family 3
MSKISFIASGCFESELSKLTNEVKEKLSVYLTINNVFVLDIGESDKHLFVIECNCFNSSGFYQSNIEKIIVDISNYMERKL